MLRSLLMAVPLVVGLAANASAALFSFSYTTSAGIITADLDGTLQPDNNSFIVDSISNVVLGGTPAPGFTFVVSADVAAFGQPAGLSGSMAALVTLDGSAMDIAICSDADCMNGIIIAAGNAIADSYGFPLVFATANAGDVFERFVPTSDSFTAESSTTAAAVVPAPGGVALFGLALLGLGLASRRRRA